jgi:hypothetical protein
MRKKPGFIAESFDSRTLANMEAGAGLRYSGSRKRAASATAAYRKQNS